MSSQKIVLDVGQCSADHSAIRTLCEGMGAFVERAHTAEEALVRVARGGVSLVLVNRILDVDGSDGLSLISEICSKATTPLPVMLVSNYPHFQQEAVCRGAVFGFGKSNLHAHETRARLEPFLR
jgi:CheY-like chemotaxis protein